MPLFRTKTRETAKGPSKLRPSSRVTVEVPFPVRSAASSEITVTSVVSSTRSGHVPRPSLLGAVVAKALAVGVDDAPDAQRLDFVFLLSLIGDPFTLAAQLTAKDRRRIRARRELLDGEHRVWNELDNDARDRARASLLILSR